MYFIHQMHSCQFSGQSETRSSLIESESTSILIGQFLANQSVELDFDWTQVRRIEEIRHQGLSWGNMVASLHSLICMHSQLVFVAAIISYWAFIHDVQLNLNWICVYWIESVSVSIESVSIYIFIFVYASISVSMGV